MVQGKLTKDFDGKTEEIEIRPCDLFIGFQIKKEETPDSEGYYVQPIFLGGCGLNKIMITKALADVNVNMVARLGCDDPKKITELLKIFINRATNAGIAKELELIKQLINKVQEKMQDGNEN